MIVRPGKSWGIYLSLKETARQLSIYDFIKLVHNIRNGYKDKEGTQHKPNLTHAALVSILYLTGGRISEILQPKLHVQRKHVDRTGNIKQYEYNYDPEQGLKFGDLAFEPSDVDRKEGDPQWLIIRKVVVKKRAPFNVSLEIARTDDEEDLYFPLVKVIGDYLAAQWNITGEEGFKQHANVHMFAFNRDTGQKILRSHCLTAHYFRHLRASHLMRYHAFSPADLKVFFSWTSETMALRYARSDRSAIRSKMRILKV